MAEPAQAAPTTPAAPGEPGTGFGLYVHWPFCQAKCPYCDFNSHVVARIDQRAWAVALAAEIAHVAARTPGRLLTSVFFGGGTPSLMTGDTVARLMDAIRAGWRCAPDLEVTLEANPTSAEAARFAAYRAAGVTRLSLGMQAMNDADLRRLGRLHSADEARAAFEIARDSFPRISFDLICARQDQTRDAWAEELDRALRLAADHLSLYQLTVEPGTAFAERRARGGLRGLPDEDTAADLYDMTVDACAADGLPLYEVSNFARAGAECRHNLLYWSGGDYAGVGPGAHGRLTLDGRRLATEQTAAPGAWLDSARKGRGDHRAESALSVSDQWLEYLMMSLRKRVGTHLPTLHAIGPTPEGFHRRAADLVDLGLLEPDGARLRTTARGRTLLDAILGELTRE